MAIGDVRSSVGRPRQNVTVGQGAGTLTQMGEGVGRALTVFAQTLGESALSMEQLRKAAEERQKQKDSFDVEQRWVRWQTDEAARYADQKRGAPVDGAGFTNLADGEYERSFGEFMASVPPSLQPEYKVLGEKYRNQRVLDAYNFEVQSGDVAAESGIKDTITALGTSLGAGQIDQGSALVQLQAVIDKSTLPEPQKQSLRDNGERALAALQFSREMEKVSLGRGTVPSPKQGDVVAAGLSPVDRTILNVIAGPESGGRYDVRNGGTTGTQTITDFSDHPRTKARNAGGTLTSAAGRYQFIEGTWDAAVAYARQQGVVVTDFSPESQDRVAALWAPKRYRELSGGRDLHADLTSGDFDRIANVRRVLGGKPGGSVEWEGFQHLSDLEFVEKVQQSLGEGGTGTAETPDVWNDPRFASIPLEDKVQMSTQAARAAMQQQAALVEAQTKADEARQDELFASAYMGQTTVDHIPTLWATGQIVSVEDEQRVRAGITAFQEKEQTRASTAQAIASGSAFTKADNARLAAWVGDEGVAAVRGMDLDGTTQLVSGISAAGVLPSNLDATFAQMLSAGSTSERAFAMEQLAGLERANPRALQGTKVWDQHGADIAFYGEVSGNYATAEETFAAISQGKELHKGKSASVVRGEAEDLLKPRMENPKDLFFKVFDDSWFSDPSITQGGLDMVTAEYREAFVNGYALTGSEKGAEAYAKRALKETWAPSALNNGMLMKYAPEALYPKVEGGHEWMQEQLAEDLDLPEDATVEVIPGLQTEEEYLRYRNGLSQELPSYNVLITWPNGEVSAKVGWFGDVEREKARLSRFEETQYRLELADRMEEADSPEAQAAIEAQVKEWRKRNAVQE